MVEVGFGIEAVGGGDVVEGIEPGFEEGLVDGGPSRPIRRCV